MRRFTSSRRASCVAALLVGSAFMAAPSTAYAAATAYECVQDSGYVIRVCIYQDGYASLTGEGNEQELTNIVDYRFVVTNTDPHDTVLRKATFRWTVSGRCKSGCAGYAPGTVQSAAVNSPISGHVYKYATYWHRAFIYVDDTGAGYQAGNATVAYLYRGKQLTYQAPNVCQGDLPGGGGGFCNSP